jgi:hypothetical protein
VQYNDFPGMENVSLLEATDVDMSQLFSFFFFLIFALYAFNTRWKQSYSMLRGGMKFRCNIK